LFLLNNCVRHFSQVQSKQLPFRLPGRCEIRKLGFRFYMGLTLAAWTNGPWTNGPSSSIWSRLWWAATARVCRFFRMAGWVELDQQLRSGDSFRICLLTFPVDISYCTSKKNVSIGPSVICRTISMSGLPWSSASSVLPLKSNFSRVARWVGAPFQSGVD